MSRTGTNGTDPAQALAAVRDGDTLVVLKLDHLARSVPDACDIGDSLIARDVRLSLGGSLYDRPDGQDVLQHPREIFKAASRFDLMTAWDALPEFEEGWEPEGSTPD